MILERMNTKNMTCEDLAKAIGVSPRTFDRMKQKHTSTWTVDQLTKGLLAVGVRMTIRTNYAED